ncbi:MAG TPA: hypothetical protein VE977_01030, partial [Pyrinomonadaceae bacterium]|nr:hypothetical protein [Pyrinomonadaceae bacterium]
MIQFFKDVKIDWLANRRAFIAVSILLMLAGLASAIARQWTPGGSEAFNLGVDFKGGTVVTVRFKQRPSPEIIREALAKVGGKDAIIQPVTDKTDTALIKIPLAGPEAGESQAQLDAGRAMVRKGL